MPLNMNFISRNGRDFAGVSPNFIVKLFEEIFNQCYPVGCYFETTDTNFDPNIAWSGTWVLEDAGLVHVSAGTGYAVSSNSKDGGDSSISYTPAGTVGKHTLVASEIPKFAGSAYFRRTSGGGSNVMSATGICARNTVSTGNTSYNQIASSAVTQQDQLNINFGGGGSHDHGFTGTAASLNNMQPYKVVNRWHRTA